MMALLRMGASALAILSMFGAAAAQTGDGYETALAPSLSSFDDKPVNGCA